MLTGPLFTAPALFVATKAKNHEQLFYYFTLVITPMFMFSGVFFPLAKLPPLVRDLILVTPLVHVVDIVRALILGRVSGGLAIDAAVILVYAVGLSTLPATALKRRLTG